MTVKLFKQKTIFSFFILLISFSLFGQDIKGLRYFMQGNATASSIPYGNHQSAGRYVKSDDAKIYYEVYGKGRPIVVLHGGIVGSPLEILNRNRNGFTVKRKKSASYRFYRRNRLRYRTWTSS